MKSFEVIALGVGDTFSEHHHTASLLLSCDGFRLAVDCPDRYRGVLNKVGKTAGRRLPLEDIEHFFITHVHGDHMNGLEGVAFYKRFAEGKRVRLHTTSEVREVIWDQRLRAPMEQLWDGVRMRTLGFEDYFDFAECPWQQQFAIGPFQITLRRTKHHVPTAAMLVRACGRTFGYSSDTAFDPELIEFLSPADLIVHETNLGPAHSAYSDLVTLPAAIRERMKLIHYPDGFDIAGSEIACLSEGDVLVVDGGTCWKHCQGSWCWCWVRRCSRCASPLCCDTPESPRSPTSGCFGFETARCWTPASALACGGSPAT
jgi:ribonuclease BN (tRNA processing enzyme)